MVKGISIIIFGYNSEKRIKNILNSIFLTKIPSNTDVEIILMDNVSTDNMASIANTYWSSLNSNISFKIIRENKQGLIFSRETAIKNSNYDLLVFLDDDNLIADDYLINALEIVRQNPEVGIIGGEIFSQYEITPPKWFHNFEYIIAVGKQNKFVGEVNKEKGFVWGAGMVVRKKVLDKLYNAGFKFSKRYYKGSLIGYADDYELCLFAQLAGYKIYYSDKLKLNHIIPACKTNFKYLKKTHFRQGLGSIMADSLLNIISNVQLSGNIRWIYIRHILNCIKSIIVFQIKRVFFFNKKDILDSCYYYGRMIHLILSYNYYPARHREVMAVYRNLITDLS